tara:strand:- start:47 stop:1027 length:981 start_codon:yes stop_codon:yes gene_type:complete
MVLKEKSYSKQKLKNKILQAGYDGSTIQESGQSSNTLLSGALNFTKLQNGVSLHFANTYESSETVSSCEIADLISFNILFAGRLSFAINEQRYQFDATTSEKIFINIINGKQTFSRFLSLNNNLKKLNLCVSKAWLIQRCPHEQEKSLILSLFRDKHAVYELSCSEKLKEQALQLCSINVNDSLKSQLFLEAQATLFISELLSLLKTRVARPVSSTKSYTTKPKRQFDKEVLPLLYCDFTVKQISNKLGTSESTMQRYFKQHFQMSVLEFIREKKLEKARRMLVIERKSIGEAAYYSGYKHVSNFVTAFKKQFAVTPRELLKQHEL